MSLSLNLAINPLIGLAVFASTGGHRRGLCVLQRGGGRPPPHPGGELERGLVYAVRLRGDQLHGKSGLCGVCRARLLGWRLRFGDVAHSRATGACPPQSAVMADFDGLILGGR